MRPPRTCLRATRAPPTLRAGEAAHTACMMVCFHSVEKKGDAGGGEALEPARRWGCQGHPYPQPLPPFALALNGSSMPAFAGSRDHEERQSGDLWNAGGPGAPQAPPAASPARGAAADGALPPPAPASPQPVHQRGAERMTGCMEVVPLAHPSRPVQTQCPLRCLPCPPSPVRPSSGPEEGTALGTRSGAETTGLRQRPWMPPGRALPPQRRPRRRPQRQARQPPLHRQQRLHRLPANSCWLLCTWLLCTDARTTQDTHNSAKTGAGGPASAGRRCGSRWPLPPPESAPASLCREARW